MTQNNNQGGTGEEEVNRKSKRKKEQHEPDSSLCFKKVKKNNNNEEEYINYDTDNDKGLEINKLSTLSEYKMEEIYRNEFNITIHGRDLSTLKKDGYLNDEIINWKLQQLAKTNETVFIFNTYFFSIFNNIGYINVCRYTKQMGILEYNKLLIPVYVSDKKNTGYYLLFISIRI